MDRRTRICLQLIGLSLEKGEKDRDPSGHDIKIHLESQGNKAAGNSVSSIGKVLNKLPINMGLESQEN